MLIGDGEEAGGGAEAKGGAVTWMQGLGASLNYKMPPSPVALRAQPYLPQGPSSTPVSMQN